eukprot:6490813-Amphidinium_carterae.1
MSNEFTAACNSTALQSAGRGQVSVTVDPERALYLPGRGQVSAAADPERALYLPGRGQISATADPERALYLPGRGQVSATADPERTCASLGADEYLPPPQPSDEFALWQLADESYLVADYSDFEAQELGGIRYHCLAERFTSRTDMQQLLEKCPAEVTPRVVGHLADGTVLDLHSHCPDPAPEKGIVLWTGTSEHYFEKQTPVVSPSEAWQRWELGQLELCVLRQAEECWWLEIHLPRNKFAAEDVYYSSSAWRGMIGMAEDGAFHTQCQFWLPLGRRKREQQWEQCGCFTMWGENRHHLERGLALMERAFRYRPRDPHIQHRLHPSLSTKVASSCAETNPILLVREETTRLTLMVQREQPTFHIPAADDCYYTDDIHVQEDLLEFLTRHKQPKRLEVVKEAVRRMLEKRVRFEQAQLLDDATDVEKAKAVLLSTPFPHVQKRGGLEQITSR